MLTEPLPLIPQAAPVDILGAGQAPILASLIQLLKILPILMLEPTLLPLLMSTAVPKTPHLQSINQIQFLFLDLTPMLPALEKTTEAFQ